MKKSIAVSLMAAAVASAMSATVSAEGAWRATYMGGYQGFDGDRDLEGGITDIVALERKLSDEWGVELRAQIASPDSDRDIRAADVDLLQGSVDLLRYYDIGQERWAPYAAIGLGHADFETDTATSGETQANLGGGVMYMINKDWSARFDARYINGLDVEMSDYVVGLGISYSFGGGSTSKPEPAPAPMKPREKDTDGDGVSDSMDRCANTPVGVVVNASGCPLDTDGDGVPDYKDKCPQTPAGRQVDASGCKFVLSRTEQIRMEVNFASNSSDVPAQYMAEVEKVASFLKKFGGVSAVIEGHTDSSGSDAYNKTLSQRRADAVKAALVSKYGINASRLTAIGYGEERPVASNETREGRSQNRRVVAVLKAEVSE
ncbi:OmpA family protein [Litorivivens sp.]|uniref:OmpA family protein n=1 Tax=Litorivivens sp. TaxID=2020868 RepID=UPI00356247F2